MSGKLWGAFIALIVLTQTSVAGHVERRQLTSNALSRDLTYLVYVPDGYQEHSESLPVLYLLHGAGGDENSWVTDGDIIETADTLIAAGAIPPTLIVMPGCRACWWIDGAKDKAETAFFTELEPHVKSNFRTVVGRSGRLIAGLSAGGYGALRYALKYPERFAAAAALSPAIYADLPPDKSAARRQPPFLDAGGAFDPATWKALNYLTILPAYLGQPARVPIYFVSGDKDDYGIARETTVAFNQLNARQPALTELRLVDGGHSWAVWSRAIGDAMRYMYGFVPKPKPVARALTQPVLRATTTTLR